MSAEQYVSLFASLATVVNGAILWPLFRALRSTQVDHGARIKKLEER